VTTNLNANSIDILLYNSKNEVVTAYTSNIPNYELNNQITIKDESKNYKVVDINKYHVMGREQHVSLELKVVK